MNNVLIRMKSALCERTIPGLLVIGLALLILLGCPSSPPVHKSARATFNAFTKHVKNGDYSRAYRYLSTDTQKRYKLNEFHGLLKKTRAGRLLRWKIEHRTIERVRTKGNNRVLIHLDGPGADRMDQYELIRETTSGGKRAWRLQYYIADEMNIPRADEELLFKNSGGDDQ